MKNPLRWIAEFVVPSWGNALRSIFPMRTSSLFPDRPMYERTIVNHELARQIYRNDGEKTNLGAFFGKAIIDTPVNFMGIPMVTVNDPELDEELNHIIEDQWAPILKQVWRDAMRDSRVYVRMWRPPLGHPLTSMDERLGCKLEVIPMERVKIIEDPRYPGLIQEAIIAFTLEQKRTDPTTNDPNRPDSLEIEEIEYREVITNDRYRFFNMKEGRWEDAWEQPNPAGFVPIVEVFNEYDSTLLGGQSEFETVYPFIRAFHDVLHQGLTAHKYHSMPKLKFKVADIGAFLLSNFPNVIDQDTGMPKPEATIEWKGREILFFGAEDDAEFIEVRSVLGDTKTLLEFLIDCISIASETPEWAFMRMENGTSQGALNAQTIPFEKKIQHKRTTLGSPCLQQLLKMLLVIRGRAPEIATVIWPEVRAENITNTAQALNQITMSLELLLQRQLVSDDTARETLRPFIKRMRNPDAEAQAAKSNFDMLAATEKAVNGNGNRNSLAPVGSNAGGGRNE